MFLYESLVNNAKLNQTVIVFGRIIYTTSRTCQIIVMFTATKLFRSSRILIPIKPITSPDIHAWNNIL